MTVEPLNDAAPEAKAAMAPEALLALLRSWGLAYTHTAHAPVFTVAESRELKAAIPGAHTKNLFLKDKAGALVLFCAAADAVVDLPGLSRALGAKGRFSFASPALLKAHLGVEPGSVTVFGLLHDHDRRVRLVLDAALLEAERVHFHPLRNDATIGVTPSDLLAFLARLGRAPERVALKPDHAPRLIVAGAH